MIGAAASMAEIKRVPWNGLTFASLFAGWGGSSLGYLMAGFRDVYANEFWPPAADVYEANFDLTVDRRDVKVVPGSEMLEMAGGTIDVLDGSPPCQGYSTAAGSKRLDDPEAIALRDLYWHHVLRIDQIRPRAFITENVTGFAKKPWDGLYFKPIIRHLRGLGFSVASGMVDARYLGVPQTRQRIVLIGFRDDEDIDAREIWSEIRAAESEEATTLGEALPHAARLIREGIPANKASSYKFRKYKEWPAHRPIPTLAASGMDQTPPRCFKLVTKDDDIRWLSTDDLIALSGFPPDFVIPEGLKTHDDLPRKDYLDAMDGAWKGFGNCVPPPMAAAWARAVAEALR